jgi:hypothetical protein
MVNYSNGKIYKIEAIDAVECDGNIYIGSTTKQYLSQRMDSHRQDYYLWKKGNAKVSKLKSFDIFEKFGVDTCRIILLETFPCKSKDELTSRESYYMKSLKCVNKVIPHRTREEYRIDNKEIIKEKAKEYSIVNKDIIAIKKRKYKDSIATREKEIVICECGCYCSRQSLLSHSRTAKHKKHMESNLKLSDTTDSCDHII